MFNEFIETWPLFQNAYLCAWLTALWLGFLGVHVVMRNDIFIGVALAQTSTLGVAMSLWLGSFAIIQNIFLLSWLGFPEFMAVLSAVIVASAFSLGARFQDKTREAASGAIYAGTASLAILIVAKMAHGLQEVQNIMVGMVLGASFHDFVGLLIICIFIVSLHLLFFRKVFVTLLDPEFAQSSCVRVRFWRFFLYLSIGISIALTTRVVGSIYVFGVMILPSLFARSVSSRAITVFWLAPLISLIAAVNGFFWAQPLDLPPGHVTVALLSVILVIGLLVKKILLSRLHRISGQEDISVNNETLSNKLLHRKLAVALTGLAIFGFVILLVLGHPDQQSVKTRETVTVPASTRDTDKAATSTPAFHPVEIPSSEDVADMKDCTEIERVFRGATDADMATALVCRALELNPKIGAQLAIDFLEDNPPFFFCQQVITKLNDIMDEPVEFDPEEPFGSDDNQKAIAKLKNLFGLQ